MAADGTLEYDILAETSGFTGPLSSARGMIGKMGTGLGALVGPAAALAGVAGGIAGIGKALGGAADLESTQVAFRTLVGDVTRADTALRKIKELGASTPFEFPELADAGRKLIAFGTSAEAVPGTLSMIGDIASGVQAPIGDIAEIFGKAQVAGTLYAEDINQLVGRGIPVIQEFARQLGVSEGEVKKMAADGKISFPMLQQAFADLTGEGGKFFGMMEAQAGTTTGLLSTLKDSVNEMFVTLGTPINDALKPVLEGAIEVVGRIGQGLVGVVNIVKAAIAQGKLGELVGTALQIGAMEGVNYLVGGFEYAVKLLDRLIRFSFKQTVSFFTGEFNGAFSGIGKGLGQIIAGVGDLVQASLGTPFQKIVANFQAGMLFTIGQVMEGIGKIPILGEKLGLADFKGQSFADLLSQTMGANDPAAIKARGEAAIKAGLGTMGDALKSGAAVVGTNFEEAFAGMDGFEAADIFNTSDLKGKLVELAKSLDPEAFKQLMAAISTSGNPVAKAAEEASKKVEMQADRAMAIATGKTNSATGGSGSNPEDNKIRLFGIEESEKRRLARMSDADKEKYAAGTRVGAANASPSLLAGASFGTSRPLAVAAAGAPPAMDPPPRRGAAAETARKGPESQLLEVLREIAGNTAPMKSLSAA